MTIPAMSPVESSNMAAVGYDAPSQTLHVQFKGGSHYTHAGVSPEAHAALMAAESKGSHYSKNIKGKFPHTKLEKPADAG